MIDSDVRKTTILIVDDSPDNIVFLSSFLRTQYRVKVATTGEKALEIAVNETDSPSLILLDVMMPGMDGYEVCQRLKRDTRTTHIPIIFLTSKTDENDEEKGLALGAVDYITKPASAPIVLARISTHLNLKAASDFLIYKNIYLESEVKRRTQEVQLIQDVTMVALGSLAETRDNETGNHIRRTQLYIEILANQLKNSVRFKNFLTDKNIESLYKSAPLHDIGKVGIPDSILKKPGKLDFFEFEIMKRHTILGRDAIIQAEKCLESHTSFLAIARDIAWCHHEKWDGSGYPSGFKADEIPIPGRLMAIPDVYDALISRRVYKEPMSHDEAVNIIRKDIGTSFDPEIANAFINISTQFKEISLKFNDEER